MHRGVDALRHGSGRNIILREIAERVVSYASMRPHIHASLWGLI